MPATPYDLVVHEPMTEVQPAMQSRPPYDSICAVSANNIFLGTAFLIAAGVLLTAGHVIAPARGARIKVQFKLQGPVIDVIDGRFANPRQAVPGYPYDIAVLKLELDPPLGKLTTSAATTVPLGKKVEVAGFIEQNTARKLFTHSGPAVDVSHQWVDYKLNTLPGQSGSPILDQGVAIGLHTLGAGYNPNYYANRGIRFTEQILRWVRSYAGT